MFNFASCGVVVVLVSVISLVSCQLPEDFDTLPISLQDMVLDNLSKKNNLEMELSDQEQSWGTLKLKNYQFEVQASNVGYSSLDPSGPILVCNGETNYTGFYDDVKTVPLLFEDAKITINKYGDPGTYVEVEYDETYYFPINYEYILTKYSYKTNDQNKIVSMSDSVLMDMATIYYLLHPYMMRRPNVTNQNGLFNNRGGSRPQKLQMIFDYLEAQHTENLQKLICQKQKKMFFHLFMQKYVHHVQHVHVQNVQHVTIFQCTLYACILRSKKSTDDFSSESSFVN